MQPRHTAGPRARKGRREYVLSLTLPDDNMNTTIDQTLKSSNQEEHCLSEEPAIHRH